MKSEVNCKLFALLQITESVWFYQLYSRLSSSTTKMQVICMRPKLLLNFAA